MHSQLHLPRQDENLNIDLNSDWKFKQMNWLLVNKRFE